MIITTDATILDSDNKVIAYVYDEAEVDAANPTYVFYDIALDLFAEKCDKLAGVEQDDTLFVFHGGTQYGNS